MKTFNLQISVGHIMFVLDSAALDNAINDAVNEI